MPEHPVPVSLATRQADYDASLARAERAGERYIEDRARGWLPEATVTEMDAAEADLRRSKRRLEATQHRLKGPR